MHLATPLIGDAARDHLGNWRAMCSCGDLDGEERATRGEAVADFTGHLKFVVVLGTVKRQYAEALHELGQR